MLVSGHSAAKCSLTTNAFQVNLHILFMNSKLNVYVQL